MSKWTIVDSQITLHWINPASLQMFVANQIFSGTDPADLLSRGVQPKHLIDNTLWWCGPDWLRMEENDWPAQDGVFFGAFQTTWAKIEPLTDENKTWTPRYSTVRQEVENASEPVCLSILKAHLRLHP